MTDRPPVTDRELADALVSMLGADYCYRQLGAVASGLRVHGSTRRALRRRGLVDGDGLTALGWLVLDVARAEVRS